MISTVEETIIRLEQMSDPKHAREMARVGIDSDQALGISIYDLRKFAAEIGQNHALALELWDTGIHEARILASYIADPAAIDNAMLEKWVSGFDTWDICDQVCALFAVTPFVDEKIFSWAERPEEFVRRASFAMIAERAWYDHRASDDDLAAYFPLLIRSSDDNRNYVKKAVSWALRNIGKRNRRLNQLALQVAEEIGCRDSRPALWIARDVIRELSSEKVQARIKD